MNRHRIFLLSAGLFATSLALGAANPQSFLDGNPQTKGNPKLSPVWIVGVDGELQHGNNPVAVTPGPHWLDVMLPTAKPQAGVKPQSVALKVLPCTYYYLAARKESATSESWKLVVDSEETLTSCNPAEEMKKAKAASPPKSH